MLKLWDSGSLHRDDLGFVDQGYGCTCDFFCTDLYMEKYHIKITEDKGCRENIVI